jgi:hypothetical protein
MRLFASCWLFVQSCDLAAAERRNVRILRATAVLAA